MLWKHLNKKIDNVVCLQKTICSVFEGGGSSSALADEVLQDLEVATSFLKYRYEDHLESDSSCSSHSIPFALSAEGRPKDFGVAAVECSGCALPIELLIK